MATDLEKRFSDLMSESQTVPTTELRSLTEEQMKII